MIWMVWLMACAALPPLAWADTGAGAVEVRPGVSLALHAMRHPAGEPRAQLVLIPGGGGGLGLDARGEPRSNNFLIRTRAMFYEAGFDVISLGNASDHPQMEPRYRASAEHVADLEAVVRSLTAQNDLPVWLIGTSRGTTSAAAAAARFGNQLLAGLVLTSSISTGRQGGAVQNENLAALRLPVLVVHHEDDSCNVTPLAGARGIFDQLKNAPVKKLLVQQGGSASGSDCGPFHHHGYEGIEAATVQAITDWIREPKAP